MAPQDAQPEAYVPHEILDKIYLARLPAFLFHLLDASERPQSGITSFLRVHSLRDVLLDLVLQVKLELLAEFQLCFLSMKERAHAKRQFVVPTHGFVPLS